MLFIILFSEVSLAVPSLFALSALRHHAITPIQTPVLRFPDEQDLILPCHGSDETLTTRHSPARQQRHRMSLRPANRSLDSAQQTKGAAYQAKEQSRPSYC